MGSEKYHFFVIDDDRDILDLYKVLLEGAGHQVTALSSSEGVQEKVLAHKPDCIISDLVLPSLSGFELYSSIRQLKEIEQPVFIIVSSRQYDYDKHYAESIGINGYLAKPINPETFVDEVLQLMSKEMVVRFWGVRGTLPVPGKNTVKYGGNTNCITLAIGKNHFFIFDAGTGIKSLSSYIMKEKMHPLSAKIFITHPHWDHINGLPYFAPFYVKNNEFEIFGANHPGGVTLEKMVSAQMDSVYFPVTVREFSAFIKYHPLTEEQFSVGDVNIKSMFLVHPGRCLGYRVEYKKKSFCYVTDNELYLETSKYYNKFDYERILTFISNADFLIIDSTYTDEEYKNKENWGHSCISRVVQLAHQANVKTLCLHHHDPEQTDDDIDRKHQTAVSLLNSLNSKTVCIAPCEGSSLKI